MLTFVWLASKAGFEVTGYVDEAVGKMSKNERGIPWVSSINLKPQITYVGSKQPTSIEIAQLHHQAHEQCYIANWIKTEVKVVPG